MLLHFKSWFEGFTIPGSKEVYRWHDRETALKELQSRHPNLFISFTKINKLGINPSSTYQTPVAVYAYPIKYVMERGLIELPFAGFSPYLQAFTFDGNVSYCHPLKNKPNAWDAQAIRHAIKELYKSTQKVSSSLTGLFHRQAQRLEKPDTIKIEKLIEDWDIVIEKAKDQREEQLSKWFPSAVEKLLSTLPDEYSEYVQNLTKALPLAISAVEKIKPNIEHQQDINLLRDFATNNNLPLNLEEIIEKNKITSDFSLIWLQTRKWANSDPKRWTILLMKLGINGVVDLGTSTIHPNEPTQAAFFLTNKIKLIATIPNQMPKTSNPNALIGLQNFPQNQRTSGHASIMLAQWLKDVEDHIYGSNRTVPDAKIIMPYLSRITFLPEEVISNIKWLATKPKALPIIQPVLDRLHKLLQQN